MLINPNESILLAHHYPRALVAFMADFGVSGDEILAGTKLTTEHLLEPGNTISYREYGALILNAMRYFPGPSLAMAFGKALHIGQHGMLGVAAMSAENLGEALTLMEKYYKLFSPIVLVSHKVEAGECSLKADHAWNLGPLQILAVETFFSGLYENCQSILGESMPAVFYFQHDRPAYDSLYMEHFGDACHFGCASDKIIFDADWLDRPLKWSNPVTCQQAVEICDKQLEHIKGQESLLSQLIRLPLIREGKVLSLDDAANELNMSGRSLRRHLYFLNTSFQQVLDKARAEKAESLLKDNGNSIADIAEQLGFSDVANFRKAFKRWLGKTPSEFRSGLGG